MSIPRYECGNAFVPEIDRFAFIGVDKGDNDRLDIFCIFEPEDLTEIEEAFTEGRKITKISMSAMHYAHGGCTADIIIEENIKAKCLVILTFEEGKLQVKVFKKWADLISRIQAEELDVKFNYSRNPIKGTVTHVTAMDRDYALYERAYVTSFLPNLDRFEKEEDAYIARAKAEMLAQRKAKRNAEKAAEKKRYAEIRKLQKQNNAGKKCVIL